MQPVGHFAAYALFRSHASRHSPTFDEGDHDESVIESSLEITVGSCSFQPLIQSQKMKNTSPKAVMKVKSKLVSGRTYGPKPPIIQPTPAMNNTILNIHGM